MSLVDIWKDSPKQLEEKAIHQILRFSGDGELRDGNETSIELRDYLSHIPSDLLSQFANQCLETPFTDSGLVLQDIVNQVGKRLGFKVEPGRYKGTKGVIGFDGIWRGQDGDTIIVEVKTSDAYRISLEIVAKYRRLLIKNGHINEEQSSILYVVGRKDTGDLEAQVRGSKHAWDIRLISLDSLIRLMELKEELEDPQIMRKIRNILTPHEYTRVDEIIDLVFSTAEDVRKDEITDEIDKETEKTRKKKFTPVNFRDACIKSLEKNLNDTLVKRSAAIYSTPDDRLAVLCVISRETKISTGHSYWFAFHPSQKETLETIENTMVCFGCGSENAILSIPFQEFKKWLDRFNITEIDTRIYWHIHIENRQRKWIMKTKQKLQDIDVTEYLF